MLSLRTINPPTHQDLWQESEGTVKEALCRVLGTTTTEQWWMQAKLAVGRRHGTESSHRSWTHCPCGHRSFRSGAQAPDGRQQCGGLPTHSEPGLLDRLNEMTGREDTEQSLEGATQREVNLAVDRKDHEDLSILIEESGSIRDESRLGSLGLPSAGSWLNDSLPTFGSQFASC